MRLAACLLALVACATPAAAQYVPPAPAATTPGAAPEAPPQGPDIKLSLPEAVALGLRQNRQIRIAYLDRMLNKFDLLKTEERFDPKLENITVGVTRGWTSTKQGEQTITDSVPSLGPRFSWLLPTGTELGGGATVGKTVRRGGLSNPSANFNWDVSLKQPLLKGAGTEIGRAPLRQARLVERGHILSLTGAVSDQVKAIIDAYYDFIVAHQQTIIARNGLERARNVVVINEALIAAGRMAPNEAFQAETNVANQELAVISAETDFLDRRRALITLLSLDPASNVIPAQEITAEPVRVDLGLARELAFENNSTYLGARIALEAAKLDLMIREDAEKWDLSLVAKHSRFGGGGETSLADAMLSRQGTTSSIGLSLTIPIDGSITSPQAELERATVQSKIALQKAEWALQDAQEAVEKGVRDAVRNVDVLWRQLELARRARGLAEQTLEVEMIKLRNGRTSNFQLLSVEDNLREAERAELSAVISYLKALATLDQQLGTTLDTWSISLND